jgi:hypothetical protein
MSEIERFIKATDAAWASASWATEDVASASAAMNDYMKARDILRGELAAREWVGLTDDEIFAIGKELGLKCSLGGNPNIDIDYARAIEQPSKEKNT